MTLPNNSMDDAETILPSSISIGDLDTLQKEIGPELSRMTLQGKIAPGNKIILQNVKEEQSTRAKKRTLRHKTQIGKGGMGTVFSTDQVSLERTVAVKELNEQYKQSKPHQEKFLEEAVIMGQLEHPNILPEYNLDKERCRLSMKKVKGETLDDILDKPYDSKEIIRQIILPVCNALTFSHSMGVIHRDLKPANIMIGEFGEVYLMDFGIARIKEVPNQSAALQRIRKKRDESVNSLTGTPSYMAPEQAKGLVMQTDERSDIYAMGCIIYEIMTGELPIEAETIMAILAKKTNPKTKIKRPSGPKELAAICMKAIDYSPEERYQTAKELQEDLQKFLNNQETSAYKYNSIERAYRWAQKNTGLMIGGLGLTGMIAATSIGAGLVINAGMKKISAESKAEKAEKSKALESEKAMRAELRAKEMKITAERAEAKNIALDKKRIEDILKTEETERAAREKSIQIQDIARQYMAGRQYALAIKELEKAIIAYPKNSEAHCLLSMMYQNLNQIPLSKEHAEQAIKLNPKNHLYHEHYALLLMQLGDLKKAEEEFDKAIEVAADFPSMITYQNRAIFRAQINKLNAALQDANKSIELSEGKYLPSYKTRARILIMDNKIDQAWPDIELMMKNNYYPGYLEKGMAEFYSKKYEDAEKSLIEAKKYNDPSEFAYIDSLLKQIQESK